MKKILLLAAFCLAAATGVSAKGGPTVGQRLGQQDTIVIKMANGAKMTLFLQNKEQLKAFQNYSLDSLMRKLNLYVQQVDSLEQSGIDQNAKEMTVTFSASDTTKRKGTTEEVTITVEESEGKSGKKERHEIRINKVFKIDVEVEEKDGDTKVKVNVPDRAERDSIRSEKSHHKFTRFNLNADVGLNNFLNTDNSQQVPDLKPIGSRYVSLNLHLKSQVGGRKSPFYILSGLEFGFNNYMFEKNVFVENVDNYTSFTTASDINYEKSKLTHSSVNIPLMPMLQFKRENGKDGFVIGAGGFVGYRLGSHAKLKYSEQGNTQKDKIRDNYNLTDFQYGLEGVVGFSNVKLFAKYNMNDLFKENRGPQANVISFGIRLLE